MAEASGKRVTGDHNKPQGTMGRVQTAGRCLLPAFLCAHIFIKRETSGYEAVSQVYQNCQRANGLAWTAWMKNQNIVAINISFLKTHRDSRILHSRTAKKNWQIMWRKRISKWQPSKLLWIWIFGAVIKVRTTEKNYYFGRLLWSCLKPQAGFAEREKKLYCRLDCSSEWMHSLYL